MKNSELAKIILNKIEILETKATMLSHTSEFSQLQIAISNLYIALSNVKY